MRPSFLAAGLIVLSVSLAAQSPQPSNAGHIIGVVVNDAGEPIPRANVNWGVVRANGSSGNGGYLADEHGQFDLSVSLDANRVSAEKLDGGYWSDPNLDTGGQVIKLSPQRPIAHVVLKLGAKPAKVNLSVVHRGSGQPIEKFEVRLSIIENQSFFRTTAIKDSNLIPIPPDKDVLLMVQAPGFKPWFFTDPGNDGQPLLQLSSGDERAIVAELDPKDGQK